MPGFAAIRVPWGNPQEERPPTRAERDELERLEALLPGLEARAARLRKALAVARPRCAAATEAWREARVLHDILSRDGRRLGAAIGRTEGGPFARGVDRARERALAEEDSTEPLARAQRLQFEAWEARR